MRTLKLQMQLSLDGFVAGPGGELDWMTWNWDDRLKEYVSQLTATVDTILLGRKTAEGFIPHWAAVAANDQDPEQDFGRIMTETPKVVFSRTLEQAPSPFSTVMREIDADTIGELKRQPGGDIIAYGGASTVSSLVAQGLIDEYYLFINPVALGSGLSIFGKLRRHFPLKLQETRAFDCGVVLLVYRPE